MATFYSYDANGALVAIFDNNGSNKSIRVIEQPVYGSNQLGTYYKQASNYQYTLADHTGNTRVIVNRNKLSNGSADVVYYADYYPFGSTLRSGGIESRYGYQGTFAEKDNETGWNNFDLRNYDANTGRWLTTDPYGQYHSPYVGMGNNPVTGFDPDGGWNPGDGWFKRFTNWLGVTEDKSVKNILLDEVVVTAYVRPQVGDRSLYSPHTTLSADRYYPTSQSYRKMMYHHSQMLATLNYNDISHPATALAIGENVSVFAATEIAAARTVFAFRTALNAAKTSASFFNGTKYTNKVLGQMKKGDFHAFPECVKAFESNGVISTIKGGYGITRQMLKIPGEYGGKKGFFEFIKEADGTINHRLFRQNP